MRKTTVSIIVPVYNAERYLHKCVASLLTQTYQDIEVILIDDGSTDASSSICDGFVDNRVRVIHKENGGVSSARNAGIEVATGMYLMFADSDDYVDKEWCSTLVDVQETFPDVLPVCNVYYVRDGQVSVKADAVNIQHPQMVSYYELFKMGLSGYPVNKIFEREIVIDSNIRFDEHMRVGEDVKFCIDYMRHKSGIVVTGSPLYYYVNEQTSATNCYHANRLKEMLIPFWLRVSLIDEKDLPDYCDAWFSYFVSMFDNVFDKRCCWTWLQKMRYNQEVVSSKQFRFCAENITGENEDPHYLKLVRTYNYYLLWAYQKQASLVGGNFAHSLRESWRHVIRSITRFRRM